MPVLPTRSVQLALPQPGYLFNAMKTTLLIDLESILIKDAHFTTKKAYDGHIGLQIFRQNAEDLQTFLADKMYSWNNLRVACRENATRSVIVVG